MNDLITFLYIFGIVVIAIYSQSLELGLLASVIVLLASFEFNILPLEIFYSVIFIIFIILSYVFVNRFVKREE